MKPFLEKIAVAENSSWSMVRVGREPTIPFEWHHHPEYELTLTTNSRGQRFVGDHMGSYDDGDLVLLAPHLPHSWASSRKIVEHEPHHVRVIQFKPEWARSLTGLLTELRAIGQLLERADRGLKFSDSAAHRVRPLIEGAFEKGPADRFVDLINILLLLATDGDAEPLTSPNPPGPHSDLKPSRIERVLEHIHANYREDIRVEHLATIAALSVSAFHRMFRRHTRQTLGAYMMQLRIGDACSQLSRGDHAIGNIAQAVGYRSLANFNRQFMRLRGEKPRDYRSRFNVEKR